MGTYQIAGVGFRIIPPAGRSFSLQTDFDDDSEGCFLHKFKAELNPAIPSFLCEYDDEASVYIPPPTFLIRERALTVAEDEDYYYLPDDLNEEGIVNYNIRYRKDFHHALITRHCARNLFPSLALRTVFRNFALAHQIVEIHAAAIEYDGGAILFSGFSGVGKSTHVNLWQEKYHVPVLNGDSPLVRTGKAPMVCGSPWCGTSRQTLNHELPLRAVVFIEQAAVNEISRLSGSEAFMRLVSVAGIPRWNTERMNLGLDCLTQMIESTPVYLLRCRPDWQAVEIVKKELDDQ